MIKGESTLVLEKKCEMGRKLSIQKRCISPCIDLKIVLKVLHKRPHDPTIKCDANNVKKRKEKILLFFGRYCCRTCSARAHTWGKKKKENETGKTEKRAGFYTSQCLSYSGSKISKTSNNSNSNNRSYCSSNLAGLAEPPVRSQFSSSKSFFELCSVPEIFFRSYFSLVQLGFKKCVDLCTVHKSA